MTAPCPSNAWSDGSVGGAHSQSWCRWSRASRLAGFLRCEDPDFTLAASASSNHRSVIASRAGSLCQARILSIDAQCSDRISLPDPACGSSPGLGSVMTATSSKSRGFGAGNPGPELHRKVVELRLVIAPENVARCPPPASYPHGSADWPGTGCESSPAGCRFV